MEDGARRFDIVLFGATGFTGRLVAEYLAKHAGDDVRWALAGRNEAKLRAVRSELASQTPRAADLPIVVADSHDVASLEALVPQARVVCTTVGPYARHGVELVASCARNGTHYCDLTGEVPFMRASIDANHAAAEASRARIVHACGFDSIPSDLGVHMVWDHARRKHGAALAWVKTYAGPTKGSASGGTIASMLHLLESASKDRAVRKLLVDPYALDPEDARHARRARNEDARDVTSVAFDRDLGTWTAPFFMAVVNTRVVRRSDALLGGAYGPRFRYTEVMSFPKGPRGFVMANAVTAGLAAFAGAAMFPPSRSLLERTVLPKPGEGPSRDAIERGYFRWKLLAETENQGSGAPVRISARVEGKRDPGYGETAKMLGEAALCLALDADRLEPRFGVLTPATSMGMRLVERLREAGMVFEVEDAG